MRHGCKSTRICVRTATFSQVKTSFQYKRFIWKGVSSGNEWTYRDKVTTAHLLLWIERLACGNYTTLSLDLWVQNSTWQKARVNVTVLYRDIGTIKAGRRVLYTVNCNKSPTLVPGSDNASFWGFWWAPTKIRLSFIHYLSMMWPAIMSTTNIRFEVCRIR